MITHKIPQKLPIRSTDQPFIQQQIAKKKEQPKKLPLHENSLLPEPHITEALDLDDLLIDMSIY